MEYPEGTKFNRWTLGIENQRGVRRPIIRRWVILPDGSKKQERLPTEQFNPIRDNIDELKKFVIRLNGDRPEELKTRLAVEIKHAYIDQNLLDSYKEFLLVQVPTPSKAITEYAYVIRYFLNFFIAKLNLANPLDWHRVHKTDWATFLLSAEAPGAAGTKKEIVSAANRFMGWLHDLRPSEVPPLKFKPLTTAILKKVEADRELAGENRITQYIPHEHWRRIEEQLPNSIKYFALFAYHYGLRRAETLGLKLGDVKKGYLSVERQLVKVGAYAPLKGRECRRVPHWNVAAGKAYFWIEAIFKENLLLHPDTLSTIWHELMNKLEYTYTFHDIRHTWITNAIRNQNQRDVQLAAGHKNIQTTMRYLHDDRTLEDEDFKPEAG